MADEPQVVLRRELIAPRDTLRRPSAWALIAANAIPLIGVLFLDWSLPSILLLYWAESAVIGFYNVLKMIRIGGSGVGFIVPFFVVHYGGFMAGHLIFLSVLLGRDRGGSVLDGVFAPGWWFAIAGMVVSHGISYVVNFLGKREYERTGVDKQMSAPYGRIMVMHVAIIIGMGISMFLGSPIWVLVLLVLLKTGVDLRAHAKEHAKLQAVENA